MAVLALDISGMPRSWITHDEAISYHAKSLVVWSLGDIVARYNGGYSRTGVRSYLETPSIIAINGSKSVTKPSRVVLSNYTLFARDRRVCAYCGNYFKSRNDLSRDHIIPRFHGGENTWMNVVTACISCNQKKGCKTLKESGMELKYVPYEPNHYENLILQNRNILSDQMDYLVSGVPKHSRILPVN